MKKCEIYAGIRPIWGKLRVDKLKLRRYIICNETASKGRDKKRRRCTRGSGLYYIMIGTMGVGEDWTAVEVFRRRAFPRDHDLLEELEVADEVAEAGEQK